MVGGHTNRELIRLICTLRMLTHLEGNCTLSALCFLKDKIGVRGKKKRKKMSENSGSKPGKGTLTGDSDFPPLFYENTNIKTKVNLRISPKL